MEGPAGGRQQPYTPQHTHIYTHTRAQIDRHSLPVFRSRSLSLTHTQHTPKHAQMVQYLLVQGAAVDESGALGRTALYWACNQARVLNRVHVGVGGDGSVCLFLFLCQSVCLPTVIPATFMAGVGGRTGGRHPPGLTSLPLQ